MPSKRVSIYILNYNGRDLLPECLPSIQRAANHSVHYVEIIVIDNHSPDNSLQIMRDQFPAIEVKMAKENAFLCSFNEFVTSDNSDIVVLMNNDIKVEDDFLDPLVRELEKDDVFFASSYCLTFDKKHYEGGVSALIHRFGWWGTVSQNATELTAPKREIYTISIGASLAIKTSAFNELGGYDTLYLPGTLEDLDLCYRGWKRGWKGVYTPDSRIYHKGQASFKPRFGSSRIRKIATRNTMFFIWKNISDKRLLFTHVLWLPLRLLASLCRFDFAFISGVIWAIMRLPEALSKREPISNNKVSDQALIDLFENQFNYLSGAHGQSHRS